jgi:pimeloyl-ACP methyl ester carboxylesterase
MSEYIGVFKRLRQRAEDARSKLRPRVFKPDAPRTVRVDDILVAIRVFGEGDPLFMIPAYVSTMDQWDPDFLSRLAMHHTVVIFDNRGMGGTTPGYAEFTMDRFALDTAGLIQALGYERAHVLGWSIGGDIALCLAANHPERVMKLVSYAGDCGGPQKIAAPAYKEILKKLHGVQGVMMKDLLAALFPAWWMEAHPDYWKQFPVPRGDTEPSAHRPAGQRLRVLGGSLRQAAGHAHPRHGADRHRRRLDPARERTDTGRAAARLQAGRVPRRGPRAAVHVPDRPGERHHRLPGGVRPAAGHAQPVVVRRLGKLFVGS